MRNVILALTILSFSAWPAVADEGHHHEELTAEQLGTVHFPVSCVTSVQKPFERGVALLHSFWYEEAEKEFQQITKDDPQCAMAHWGVAISLWHQLWNHPDAATIKRGQAEVKKAKSLRPKTDRERDYIAAIRSFYDGKHDHDARADAYSKAMEQMYQHYPDDREAAAFYALSLLAAEPDNDSTFVDRKKAAAVLEKLFAEEPDHPGVAHYLIHSYDKPQLAELGLPAARRYAKIAPASPHALHMPSHIFARLGLWQDDIDSNLASIAATRKTAAMHMGGEGHQFHAMDFLVYAYMQSGHEAEAERVFEEVKAMPAMKDMYGDFDPRMFALVAFPARYVLEMHHWADAASLQPVPGADRGDSSVTYWARAIGAARSGNAAQARKDVAEIEAIHENLLKKKKNYFADAVDQDRQEAAAWVAHAEGKDDEAMKMLRAVAEKQEAVGEESDGGIPAREMLADLLLEINRPEQALAEYETDLKFYPNRFNGLYGAARAAEMAGKTEKANTYYAQVVKVCDGSSSDRPELSRAKALLAQK
jgi:tetratricopeptide (TPR) repeat protein